MSSWCIVMSDIPESTLVWAPYIYFLFSIYQNLCICITFSKSICSIKEHWWSLALSWSDEVQKIFSTAHERLSVKIDNINEYMFFFIYTFYRYKLWYIVLIDFVIQLLVYSHCISSYMMLFFYFLTKLYLAHARFLLTPCRFVPVLIPVRGGLGEHFKPSR